MNGLRQAIADFTGAHKVCVLAGMTDFDGPVGVEGFIGANQVIGLYEGIGKIAFVMGNGNSGYLGLDGSFEYRPGPLAFPGAAVFPGVPPIAANERTASMIRKEIEDLFVLSNSVELIDWCTA